MQLRKPRLIRFAATAAGALLALVFSVSACAPTADIPLPVTGDPTVSAGDPAGDAYPVRITHKYGSVTLTTTPQRIVSVGLTEQDALLALGVVPVATREWYGQRPGAIFPWAEDLLAGRELPEVLGSELDFERIASLQPDLIVGLYSGLTEDEYGKLSQIAPTVAQPAEYVDWGIPWQEQTLTLGRILGQEQRAEELVAAVEERFAQARDQNPILQGASAAVVSTYGFPESYYAYSSQDVRGRFLTSLGLQIPAEVDRLAANGFGASLSREQLHLVDLDLLIWVSDSPADLAALKEDPLYQQLSVAAEGRDVFLGSDNSLYDALNFSSVLSLPYAIDQLAPLAAAALDGDPATQTTP